MFDFSALEGALLQDEITDPIEIFREMPKPSGFNDLYSSQADVLKDWYNKRTNKDNILKLHTGGGKTLVGLLIAKSILNETKKPVVYLCINNQLVEQTLEKARLMNFPVCEYIKGEQLHTDFFNAQSILVCNYNCLFNGRSKFGVKGSSREYTELGGVILDDAHSAFSILRDVYTLNIDSDRNKDLYARFIEMFTSAFDGIDKSLSLHEIVNEQDTTNVLEVPYWSWLDKCNLLAVDLSLNFSNEFVWPLIKDNLKYCHVLISHKSITITPILPIIESFPSFSECPRRVFMSATIADDSELIRSFGVSKQSLETVIKNRSLAGIGERMIFMPNEISIETLKRLFSKANSNNVGTLIITPSDAKAQEWKDYGYVLDKENINEGIDKLLKRTLNKPVIVSNRYDGIDLAGDSCRLLILDGLPTGTSPYDIFKSNSFFGSKTLSKMIAQRVEQGIGRAARGGGDFCVVILIGEDLKSWISQSQNYEILTAPSKIQLEIGRQLSNIVSNESSLIDCFEQSLSRDIKWTTFHARTLAQKMDEMQDIESDVEPALTERKIFNYWIKNQHQLALDALNIFNRTYQDKDLQVSAWLYQLCGRISYNFDGGDYKEYQRSAYQRNSNLLKPLTEIKYTNLVAPQKQSFEVAKFISSFQYKDGIKDGLKAISLQLNSTSSANQFEKNLDDLAKYLGFSSRRFDERGKGPDLIWKFSNGHVWVIEAKSRKIAKYNKENHGQLLIAGQWYVNNFNSENFSLISIVSHTSATFNSEAESSNTYALLISEIQILVSNLIEFYTEVEAAPSNTDWVRFCEEKMELFNVREADLNRYLKKFRVE
ncbi:DEAD/DEAH box helicase family protein [Acinetobacter sp. AG1]|uniref:DEAD/DEAH box helicase family protein n=1 Tax=Acinetobacter sp. AG1 TaxID=348388 RepID=UPI00069AFFDB|nr:DEAD/DEAH box helicase family protein [Acinetobacter sp. AG1]